MNAQKMMTAAIVASALLAGGCKQETEAPAPVRPVLSMVIEPSAMYSSVAAGIIEARYKTDLSFRVLGQLISRPVNIGDLVTEGATVATIDSSTLELAVRSAKAELSRAQAQLANAMATEKRKQVLVAKDVASKANLDGAEYARAGAEAAVARAEANLTKALEQLGYAQLKVDFSGFVTAVGADIGQVVSPGQTVVTVARPDIREAVVDIGPDFPFTLKVGMPFVVSLQLRPSVQALGTIREVAPQADPITRMRRVRIALQEPPPTFRLGSTVTAQLQSGQLSVLRIPESAVLKKDEGFFVWVIHSPENRVSLHKVELSKDEAGVRVIGGLAAGMRIATAGIHSLHEGQQVRFERDSTP